MKLIRKNLIFIILLLFYILGCQPPGGGGGNYEWTIMVYVDGDNNLETAAFVDINEMEAADLTAYDIKVIVLMDGNGSYYAGTSAFSNTRLYEICYDSAGDSTGTGIVSERLTSPELGVTANGDEELNMGNPATASNFIDFCKNNYPADNYAFIFWNHGSGWRSTSSDTKAPLSDYSLLDSNLEINCDDLVAKSSSASASLFKAVCVDESSGNDLLYTQEIGTAVGGKGLTIIGFDVCYAAMMEIAYEIRNEAAYLIGSEETEPGDGWEYDDILNSFKTTTRTAADFYTAVINAYATRYASTSGTTLSAIDLSEIDDVMSALNDFSDQLYASCTTDAIRDSVTAIIFNDAEDYFLSPGDLNIDIYDMASEISSQTNYADTEASSLMTAINNAVKIEWHHNTGNPQSHGLALHYVFLDAGRIPVGHDAAYDKAYSGLYPLMFMADSNWVRDTDTNIGLLYRLWYEPFP